MVMVVATVATAATVIQTIKIAVVAAATTAGAFIAAARWPEALLYGVERQSVDEAHMFPIIVLAAAVAVANAEAFDCCRR
jgi:hypothetical protein